MTKKQLIDGMDARYETGFAYRATGQTDGTCSNVVENITYSKIQDAALTEDERLTYSYYDDGNIRKTDHKKKDADGNFVTYSTDYVYDALGQLVRVNDQEEGKTRVYTYNAGFNMTSEKVYAYTTAAVPGGSYTERTFVYDSVWKDQLDYIRINNSENRELAFDSAGNLTGYNGNSYTWKNGRQLAGITKSDGTQIGYSYDHNGMRVKKTVGSNIHSYRYCGSLLMEEKAGSTTMRFSYDSLGNAVSVLYNGTEYYYMRNLQGDVIGLINKNGEWVVRYRYDVWGNVLEVSGIRASTLGQDNPIRYRGYCYDAESGLYYVSSRYYDPQLCRFISADTTDILGVSRNFYDKNLYVYCDNNPIIRKDATGSVWETVLDVGSLAASVVEVAINPTDVWAWAGLVGDAIDLVPFVTGVGEVTRLAKASSKADDVVAAARTLKNSKKVSTSVGTYEILYASGKNYVGKGPFSRAIQSAIDHAKPIKANNNLGDTVISIRWKMSYDNNSSFMEEYALQTYRKVNNRDTYNKIWSPGKKLSHNLRE